TWSRRSEAVSRGWRITCCRSLSQEGADMATWQERMQEAADQAYWQVTLSGACGWCVDEGERVTDWIGLHPVMNRLAEDRPAEFHYSRLDALDVVRAGYLGAYAADDANSKSVKLQG